MADEVDRGPLSADEIAALSKKYTLYEWVAQDVADPIAVATARLPPALSPASARRFGSPFTVDALVVSQR